MKKILITSVAALILAPSLAYAAQPTASSIIRQSLRSWGTTETGGQTIKLDVGVNYKKTYNDKKRGANEYAFNIQVGGTDYPVTELLSNSELNYAVPKVLIKNEGETVVDAVNAFSADARVFPVEKTVYARLNHLDSNALQLLSELGIGLNPLMGQWVKFSLTEDVEDLLGSGEASALTLSDLTDEAELKQLQVWYLANELKLGSPVIVSSVGRITKNAAGEKVQTVRVIPNSRWYPAIEKMAVSEFKKNNPDANATELREFQTEFKAGLTKFKQAAAKTNVQVTVNLTTAKITGLSVKFQDARTAYRTTYSYVRGKEVARKVAEGRETMSVQANLSWMPAASGALEAPSSALEPEAAWNLIYKEADETLLES